MTVTQSHYDPEGNSTTTTDLEEYVTVKVAARFLGMPMNTLYKLALARQVPSYKTGKLRRFKLSELAAVMESNKIEMIKSR